MSRHAGLLLQSAVSVVLMALLLRGVVWGDVAAAIARVPPLLFLAAFAVTVAGQVLYALKWYIALRVMAVPARFGQVLEQYVIGIFFNNFLPSTIGGDWAKVYYLGRREGYLRVGASVFIDRYLGALYLTVLATALLWLPIVPQEAWRVPRAVLTAMAAALVGGGFVAVLVPPRRMAGRFAEGEGVVARVARQAGLFADHVRTILRHPYAMLMSALIVVGYFLLLAIVYRLLLARVAAGTVEFAPMLAAITVIAAVSMIPISVNGIGLREQMHVLLLAAVGISTEAAFAVSLVLFAQLLIVSVAGWLLWLRHRRPEMADTSAAAANPAAIVR